jgi:hypothetical protein
VELTKQQRNKGLEKTDKDRKRIRGVKIGEGDVLQRLEIGGVVVVTVA